MRFHLKRHHRDFTKLETKDNGQIQNKALNHLKNKRGHNVKAFEEEENEDENFDSPSTSMQQVNEIPSETSKTKIEQITIVDSFVKQNSFKDGGSQSNKINNLLLFMLAKDLLPYRTVEKEGFLLFTKSLAPLYKVPCRKTITNLMMKDKLKSITIGVVDLNERHTSEYIQSCLESELNQWKISKSQIVIIVSDNGANIKKAIKEGFGENIHMPCFAHNLHLVVSKVLQSESKSVMAADYLRVISNLKLIMAVETRWNSTYYMLERFVELSEKHSTKIVCGENYVSASKLIPIINILKVTIRGVEIESEAASHMKTLLLDELQNRFNYIEDSLVLSISTILDPRFKQVHFNDENAYSKAINNDFWFYHENLINLKKRRLLNVNNNDIPSELKYYLDEPPMKIEDCPIKFWYTRSSTLLSKLALKYLSVVGTSVPSERLFSKAGRILNESRNRLNCEHLQELLFLGSLSKEDWYLE
ncbi:zinc finger BED domain-containing protein 4-like [Prorops nasuta]|uniref:zinc finger BED domain-containing protein 4-like n=1 Tax=Prorops nasuta TaxID=863751 RepID=UPI0034CF102E